MFFIKNLIFPKIRGFYLFQQKSAASRPGFYSEYFLKEIPTNNSIFSKISALARGLLFILFFSRFARGFLFFSIFPKWPWVFILSNFDFLRNRSGFLFKGGFYSQVPGTQVFKPF